MRKAITTLFALTALAVAAQPAHANHYDHLLPAPGSCGPGETDVNVRHYDQATAGACLVNAARSNFGRRPLGPQWGRLYIAAGFKARDIMTCQRPEASWTWAHTACGRPMDYWVKRYNYGTGCASWGFAENFYHGSGAYGTARAAVSWWLHSDGHRNNMLGAQWRHHAVNKLWYSGTFQGHPETKVWVHYMGYSC
jgi:hypothetical protein